MSLDVALLLDKRTLQEWEHRAINHLLHESDLNTELSLVVINDEKSTLSLKEKISTFVTDFSLWNCFVASKMFKTAVLGPAWYRKQVYLEQTIETTDVNTITCLPQPADRFGNVLPEYVVSALADVDVAIRFGFGILKGDVLTAPSHGILSYHHGDISEYRGRPAGFYEFIHDSPTAGVTVQQLSEDLDAGTVVAMTTCDIEDASSLREVRSKQFAASPPLLSEAVRRLTIGPLPEQPETFGPLYSTPRALEISKYLSKRVKNWRIG